MSTIWPAVSYRPRSQLELICQGAMCADLQGVGRKAS